MDQAIFEQWKMQLELLDRYENQADCQMFLAMVEAVTHCLSDDVIDVLLGTFGNAHDHGVQESVMRVLDHAPPRRYAARLHCWNMWQKVMYCMPSCAAMAFSRNIHKPRCFCSHMACEGNCLMDEKLTRMQSLRLHNEGALN